MQQIMKNILENYKKCINKEVQIAQIRINKLLLNEEENFFSIQSKISDYT